MGKIVKLTEAELHKLIKEKIQEALEHNVDLEYSPAIGNKKRGPGKDTMDQMRKRRNTKLDESFDEEQGPHDESVIYDDVYPEIEPCLDKWGASPVYGYCGNKGVCFSIRDGRWVVIKPMGFNGYYNDDSFLVTVADSPVGDPEDADNYYSYVYLYDLCAAITKLISKPVNESKKKIKLSEKSIYRRLPDGDLDYDGEDGEGDPAKGNYTLEISDDAYAYAFEKVYGRVPGDISEIIDENELPFEVSINVTISTSEDPGDYDTPSNSTSEIEDWELAEDLSGLDREMYDVVMAAVEYEVEALNPDDVKGYICESLMRRMVGRVLREMDEKKDQYGIEKPNWFQRNFDKKAVDDYNKKVADKRKKDSMDNFRKKMNDMLRKKEEIEAQQKKDSRRNK